MASANLPSSPPPPPSPPSISASHSESSATIPTAVVPPQPQILSASRMSPVDFRAAQAPLCSKDPSLHQEGFYSIQRMN
ncbi:hypothetical protein QQP08_011685 [Theobroma cacao]|nr:hypothetical protein QQP08_011685 [Theobroma cacao]